MSDDDNPRPPKRQRTTTQYVFETTDAHSFKARALSNDSATDSTSASLLLSLPNILLHPPNHKRHSQSIFLSLFAFRRYLDLEDLDRDVECQAWTGLAELWLVCSGLGYNLDLPGEGDTGVVEVEKALTKGLLIAQKHPSLRLFIPYLTILSSRFSHHQQNFRFAHHTIKRLIASSLASSDPLHVIYSAHIALIHSLLAEASSTVGADTCEKRLGEVSPSMSKCLGAIQDMYALAKGGHGKEEMRSANMMLLALIQRVQVLVTFGIWSGVDDALRSAEQAFRESFPDSSASGAPSISTPTETIFRIHLLILGVLYFTYTGNVAEANDRLRQLHLILDSNAMSLDRLRRLDGILEIPVGPDDNLTQPERRYPCLYLKATHPRIIYFLVYLLSAVAKRDPIGRRPKKAVFAKEGLAALEREGWMVDSASCQKGTATEIMMPLHASLADCEEIQLRVMKIKADLLSEVVAISIMRSEYEEAERALNALIAHTRTHSLFDDYAARITLQQAQMAHARGQTERALQCYQVAAWIASAGRPAGKGQGPEGHVRDDWISAAARAGEAWVRIGLLRSHDKPAQLRAKLHPEDLKKLGADIYADCQVMGSGLKIVGELIMSCLSNEFLKAKRHLRQALSISTESQDNHIRVLILALISSHYLHTAPDHAQTMLDTCDQLAAGLGASNASSGEREPGKATGNKDGNYHLRLWTSHRKLDLLKRVGRHETLERQATVIERLKEGTNS